MHSRLKEILLEKEKEVALLKKAARPEQGRADMTRRDFKNALSGSDNVSLIAEIKFASPSAGTIRAKSDPVLIGKLYAESGAAAISLLTDKRFFGGDIKHLPRLKDAVSLPVLRKDFLIDPIQVEEAFVYGADAILLIARILSAHQLKKMLALCHDFKMAALTEVHNRTDLDKAVNAGATIIGINNRDLDTFDISLDTTVKLAPHVPDNCVLVSESGIMEARDIRLLKKCNLNAVLVGSSIMRNNDPGAKVRELVAAGHEI